ncbi:ATP-binding cassette domain-containing protein [Micromonospora cathayae]|uniref:ATP-binding cassette domain-containing protein n=1 Tax=Micromonospora cathayae TaxID=3028804 RepID=A0ABY7ZLG4_9ACTN|nr:ATP-binding cassette domain-containing protein [Micromonospora sp. HUAS 3]WDZ83809.1 ATP-binding cassette domain-containing protein [Micromonospora sp. HUAS 3]
MLTAITGLLRLSWRQDRRKMIVALALMAGNAVAVPAAALALKHLTNAAAAGDAGTAAWSGVAVTVAAIAALTCAHFAHIAYFEVSELNVLSTDEQLIEISNGTPYLDHHERPEHADRMALAQDELQRIGEGLQALLTGGSLAVSLLLTTVLLTLAHPALVVLPLLAALPLLAGRRAQAAADRAREDSTVDTRQARHLFELTTDAASAKELRLLGLVGHLQQRYATHWRRATARIWRGELTAGLWRAAGQAVFALGYVAALVLVVRDAVRGRAGVGDVVLAIVLASQLNQQVASAVTITQQLVRSGRSLRRLDEVRALVPQPTPPPAAPPAEAAAPLAAPGVPAAPLAAPGVPPAAPGVPPAAPGVPPAASGVLLAPPARLLEGIRLRQVTFTYPGAAGPVLRDVDLLLPAGSTVAIVGENGAGKTTLVKLLNRFYEPDRGAILVDGVDLRDLDLAAWRARTTAAFQDYARPELTAGLAVGIGDLPRAVDDDAVRTGLARAHSTVVDRLPYGLDTRLGRSHADGGVDVSGGQWQQLALGRAMMRDAPLLMVLDEPASALDAEAEHRLFERYADGAARVAADSGGVTVFVSHRFSTVRTADLIIVIGDGGVREVGTHDELIRLDGTYAALYGTQAAAYR